MNIRTAWKRTLQKLPKCNFRSLITRLTSDPNNGLKRDLGQCLIEIHNWIDKVRILFDDLLSLISDLIDKVQPHRRVVAFGIDAPEVTADVGWFTPIAIEEDEVFRPISAWMTAHEPPTGSSLKATMQYSIDDTVTWEEIFLAPLELPAGAYSMDPVLQFVNWPDPLDIPRGALVRCGITQVGSTTAGVNVYVHLNGIAFKPSEDP